MSENLFETLQQMGHEQVVFCSDPQTGLKAIIAVHNTVLGPALGGTRLWNYATEAEALTDVLRLSRGMSFKNAIAGLNLGGGKAVIIGNPRQMPSEAALRIFGKYIKNLNGKYITAEDVGMSTLAMEYIALETKHVAGMPHSRGGSGDPSPFTALGTYVGIKAAVKKVFGNDSLEGKKIGVQGAGNVGGHLIGHLAKEGAKIYVTDIFEDRLKNLASKYTIEIVGSEQIYDLDMDVYSPCALGATVNDETLNRLKSPIIAGAANNQLADEQKHGNECIKRGITYVPDFLINAGGVINIATEVAGTYNPAWATSKVEALYYQVEQVIHEAADKQRNAQEIAMEIATRRIAEIGRMKAIY